MACVLVYAQRGRRWSWTPLVMHGGNLVQAGREVQMQIDTMALMGTLAALIERENTLVRS